MKPGEIITKEGNITINKDLKIFTLTVSIQVTDPSRLVVIITLQKQMKN